MNHSPGPWHGVLVHAGPKQGGGNVGVIVSTKRADPSDERRVAAVLIGHDEGVANAGVIAALPELLAVVEAAAAHFEGTDSPLAAQARTAIERSKWGNAT